MNRRAVRWAAFLAVVLLLGACSAPAGPLPASPTTATLPATTTGGAPACPLGTGCPRPEVTPGAVIVGTEGLCTATYNPRRELTEAAKRRVLAAYGFPPGVHVAEWDHLIARWAGGTSTASNVWPQLDERDKQRKDALEARLYGATCRDRTMSLATAREQMRVFWRYW
jgi:hypothetical protein